MTEALAAAVTFSASVAAAPLVTTTGADPGETPLGDWALSKFQQLQWPKLS